MSGNKRKVVLVGTGMVGMSFAYAALNQNVCDELIMIDLNEKRAEGEVELMYVQDADRLHNRATALGVNCPNCGAPVKTLGEKFCQFCGTAIKEINIRSWKFNSVNEQTLQQRKF